MNVRIATIPTSEPTIPPKLSKVLGDSRRVLHLNSLTILVVKTIYTLRTEVRREKLSRDGSSQKGALTY